MLLVRSGERTCAIPLEQVVETMRPLPVSRLAGTEPFVAGAAVIRGEPVPVVDLDAFLGTTSASAQARFVVVRCGGRRAALAVDRVLGIAALDERRTHSVPLLDGVAQGAIEALGSKDRELLAVLQAALIVPETAWRALESAGDRS